MNSGYCHTICEAVVVQAMNWLQYSNLQNIMQDKNTYIKSVHTRFGRENDHELAFVLK